MKTSLSLSAAIIFAASTAMALGPIEAPITLPSVEGAALRLPAAAAVIPHAEIPALPAAISAPPAVAPALADLASFKPAMVLTSRKASSDPVAQRAAASVLFDKAGLARDGAAAPAEAEGGVPIHLAGPDGGKPSPPSSEPPSPGTDEPLMPGGPSRPRITLEKPWRNAGAGLAAGLIAAAMRGTVLGKLMAIAVVSLPAILLAGVCAIVIATYPPFHLRDRTVKLAGQLGVLIGLLYGIPIGMAAANGSFAGAAVSLGALGAAFGLAISLRRKAH